MTAVQRLSDQPVLIAETASAEEGGDKADWIRRALLHDLPIRFPRVRGLVWFDENKEREWSVSSSPAARRAFAEAASHPYLAGVIPAGPNRDASAGRSESDRSERPRGRDRNRSRRPDG